MRSAGADDLATGVDAGCQGQGRARQVPEVIELQSFLGSVDVRLSVIARDMADWQRIYRDRILPLPHVTDIEPLMLVSTIKDTGELAL